MVAFTQTFYRETRRRRGRGEERVGIFRCVWIYHILALLPLRAGEHFVCNQSIFRDDGRTDGNHYLGIWELGDTGQHN